MEKQPVLLRVSDFVALTNQTLDYAYSSIEVEGEVASFKTNQGKYVFFDLKDADASVGCFMMLWQLRTPIEDGMKVIITATPKLTQWGKFSLTVRQIRPSGEGSMKKSFELLKAKLTKEGLFASERKRSLPPMPMRVAVISSMQAAGYVDFMKIVGDRWGGLHFLVANVQVQGAGAPDQIVQALRHFNEMQQPPEVIVIVRGGGSADDLSAFNDELLVREIAASRVPTLVGVGHEVDVSLADMAADVRAATPSNAAQLLVPDKKEVARSVHARVAKLVPHMTHQTTAYSLHIHRQLETAHLRTMRALEQKQSDVGALRRALAGVSPYAVLARGYAIIRGEISAGSVISIEQQTKTVKAEVIHVTEK